VVRRHWGPGEKGPAFLAEIDTPEVDQHSSNHAAISATAEANLRLAEITKNRYQDLLKTNAVSQQDVDNAAGTYNANNSIVQANQANVKQLETLQSFEKIYAPFDGIVTVRNVDVGDLINSGSASWHEDRPFPYRAARKIARVCLVPQEYSQAATPGLTAELTLDEFPGGASKGSLVRTANAINNATVRCKAEVDVDNPTGKLLSGSYAEVHLKLPGLASTHLLPVDTLLFRSEGLQVAVVKESKVVLTQVTPGHDFRDQIEILSGLNGDESVISKSSRFRSRRTTGADRKSCTAKCAQRWPMSLPHNQNVELRVGSALWPALLWPACSQLRVGAVDQNTTVRPSKSRPRTRKWRLETRSTERTESRWSLVADLFRTSN